MFDPVRDWIARALLPLLLLLLAMLLNPLIEDDSTAGCLRVLTAHHMWWFADHSAGVIDAPTVISAPMWLYRALFFGWACWMAFALVRWLRRAFSAWTTGGVWRRE